MLDRLYAIMEKTGARKITKFISTKRTIKLTRTFRMDKKNKRETFVLTTGEPNSKESRYIKMAIIAKVKFPINKLQIKYYD